MKYLLFPLLVFSVCQTKAASLNDVFYSMPILICHDERYLSCQENSSEIQCAKEMKIHRDSCTNNKISNMDELISSMGCMILGHNNVSAVEEFEEKCEGGMNINLTKLKEYVAERYTQEEIAEILK